MDAGALNGLIAGGSALAGVVLGRLLDLFAVRAARKHELLALRRQKFEELALLLIDSIHGFVASENDGSNEGALNPKGPVPARRILMLAQLYFPPLRQPASAHLSAWVLAQVARSKLWRAEEECLPEREIDQARAELVEARDNLRRTRAKLETAIEVQAGHYFG